MDPLPPHLRQSAYGIRFDWGLEGLRAAASADALTVLVDILSFTTCVSAAMDRGAEVFPYRFHDDTAKAFAAAHGAHLAGSRKDKAGFSLSPASLLRLQSGDRVVLPSPNGSALSLEARGRLVIAACLRNAEAVSAFLRRQAPPITVIAAGERWPNGTLRPALEDLLGAGALLSRLQGNLSPEAELAAETYAANKDRLAERIENSVSGRELKGWGYDEDVRIACEVDTSPHVPLLVENRFVRAPNFPTHS